MDKKYTFLLSTLLMLALGANAQIDTLAWQNFETVPAPPVWYFSGTITYNSGYTTASATPPNSPIGIGGSRAWHVVQVSGGQPATFANQIIPTGYDSIKFKFKLAAMNLNGSSGGPDNLDYVLVEYSLNGGATFTSRIRIRGAVNDNCSWSYAATQTASAYYLPATEALFQPINSGLVESEGLSTVEIVFPGTITQLTMRVTPRSSSSSDHWLLDDVLLIGQSAVPLPVAIKRFYLDQHSKGKNQLTWQVAQEKNLSHYELQRSTNGIDFTTIATQKAINSVGEQAYSYADNYAAQCYYRLKMVDVDNRFSFSEILKATLTADHLYTLSPNPINTLATLQTNAKHPAIVQVVNMHGCVLVTYNTAGQSRYPLDFSALASGMYALKINTAGTVQHILFQKL